MSRVPAVISAGLAAAAGMSLEDAANAAFSGRDSLSQLRLFESPRHADKFVAAADIPQNGRRSRCERLLIAALDEALANADLGGIARERIAVFAGTSIGGIFETENMLERNRKSGGNGLRELAGYECSTLAEIAAKRAGALGECAAFSTACSSSSIALAEACNAISQGACDAAIVCGVDALSRITVNGFGSLLLLSKGKCSPFDKNRDGINLGEAAGVMILAADGAAKGEPLAYISGWARTCDAYHATAPAPDGDGAARAMSAALGSSTKADYYNAHGTATRGNDTAEAAALKKVFGQNIPPFSSLKRVFGHTLGASGIVNAILSVEAIKRSKIPPNAGFETFDEEVGIAPEAEVKDAEINTALTVSLGFGGNNAAVAISRKKPQTAKPAEKRRVFVYGFGIVGDGGIAEDSALLPNIPPLKKRKFAHLQKMGLQAAETALARAKPKAEKNRTAVCWGTGLGMTSQTLAFVENVFEKREAEPMPTAFTNSVHNAVPSAIAVREKFGGLNSAATAKEISFECAMAQTLREIYCGGADAAVVCAGDEHAELADEFLKQRGRPAETSDFAAAYFVGTEHCAEAEPLAEILALDIARILRDANAERARAEKILADIGLSPKELDGFLASTPQNAFQKKRLDALAESFGTPEFSGGKYGANYCVSAAAIAEKSGESGKIFARYTMSSTNMRALTVFKIL